MGALAFFLLMIIMLGAGIMFLLTGTILYILYRKKKDMAKHPKLRRNAAIAFLLIGIINCIIPLGWFAFIRSGNAMVDEDYIDTGIMVRWTGDEFIYGGEKYVEFVPQEDIFYYDANEEIIESLRKENEAAFNTYRSGIWNIIFNDEERSVMYRLDSGTGETLYYDGWLYCREDAKEDLQKYYADDANYEWYLVTWDEEDDYSEQLYPLEITGDELTYLYNMEYMEKDVSVFIDDEAIEHADLMKISKDKVICAWTAIIKYEDVWYWNTEMVDESNERDDWWATYVQKLPDSLQEKMSEIE